MKLEREEFKGNILVTISAGEVRLWVCNEEGQNIFRFKALGKVFKSGKEITVFPQENNMKMAVKGIKTDFDKFERLKTEYWEQSLGDIWVCKKHETYFDPNEEPCWQCVNECTEEL